MLQQPEDTTSVVKASIIITLRAIILIPFTSKASLFVDPDEGPHKTRTLWTLCKRNIVFFLQHFGDASQHDVNLNSAFKSSV